MVPGELMHQSARIRPGRMFRRTPPPTAITTCRPPTQGRGTRQGMVPSGLTIPWRGWTQFLPCLFIQCHFQVTRIWNTGSGAPLMRVTWGACRVRPHVSSIPALSVTKRGIRRRRERQEEELCDMQQSNVCQRDERGTYGLV